MLRRPIVIALALALLAAACGGSSRQFVLIADGPGGVYLALGDSIAAGNGASNPGATSYVGLVATKLRKRLDGDLELRKLAIGGATTQHVINDQLDPAVQALENEDVRLVTISISGNDLADIQSSPDAAACIADVTAPPCPVIEVLVGTEERLDTILRRLREAGPDTPIVIQVYPNFFSGTGSPFEQAAEQAFGLINDVVLRVAARYDIIVADPRDAFAGRGGELTHILDPTPDNHPTDDGYRVIADAFLKALGIVD